MAGVQRSRAGETSKPRPYFIEKVAVPQSDEWQASVRELVGFDITLTRERISLWLQRSKVAGYDHSTDAVAPTTPEERKARAAFKALVSLLHLQQMWAPERVAARRWYRVLLAVRTALSDSDIVNASSVRQDEDAFIFARTAGDTATAAYKKRLKQTRGVLAAARALDRRARDAMAFIPRYEGDALSAFDADGKPLKAFLGSIELDLKLAGFTFPEIARLIADDEALPATSRTTEAAADRVRKRVTLAKGRRSADNDVELDEETIAAIEMVRAERDSDRVRRKKVHSARMLRGGGAANRPTGKRARGSSSG